MPEKPSSPPEFALPPGTVVPLFPLPNLYLVPGALLPLHVFEPRYRQMLEDLMDGPGRFVLGTVLEDHESELAEAPPVFPVGGLAEIGRHERLPDGRFLIVVVGLQRVRTREVESDRLYRKVEIETLNETPPSRESDADLRPLLIRAIETRGKLKDKTLHQLHQLPTGQLADLLLLTLRLPQAITLEIYGTEDITERARQCLDQHARTRPGAGPPSAPEGPEPPGPVDPLQDP